jgi:hypothetical protein
MAEHREHEADRILSRDLQALRAATNRDLPTIHDSARLARRATDTREGLFMKGIRFFGLRPILTTVVATAAVLTILFVIPISYQRTVGQDVTLTLAQAPQDAQALAGIAQEMKATFGAEGVRVMREASPAGTSVAFHAMTPVRSHSKADLTAQAFAAALRSKGFDAKTEVTPRTQRVATNVYAWALDPIQLHIDRNGRSAGDIEADIRRQLESAGVQNAQVHVTQDGDQTQVKIEAHDQEGQAKRDFDIQLDGRGTGSMDPTIHRFEVKRTPGMTDADVKADIERQMRDAGVDGTVTVENGEVKVEVHKRQ